MSLTAVKMSEDVWLTCLTHALSTETEEIMGLLLGDIEVLFLLIFTFFFLVSFHGDSVRYVVAILRICVLDGSLNWIFIYFVATG